MTVLKAGTEAEDQRPTVVVTDEARGTETVTAPLTAQEEMVRTLPVLSLSAVDAHTETAAKAKAAGDVGGVTHGHTEPIVFHGVVLLPALSKRLLTIGGRSIPTGSPRR